MKHVEVKELELDVLSSNGANNDRANAVKIRNGNSVLSIRSRDVPNDGSCTPTGILTLQTLEDDGCRQETDRQDDALRGLIGLGGEESNLLFQRRSAQRGVGGAEREWPELWDECHRVVMRHYAKAGDANGYSRTARCMRECSGFIGHYKRRRYCSSLGEIPEVRPDGALGESEEAHKGV